MDSLKELKNCTGMPSNRMKTSHFFKWSSIIAVLLILKQNGYSFGQSIISEFDLNILGLWSWRGVGVAVYCTLG